MAKNETVFVSNPYSIFRYGSIEPYYKENTSSRAECINIVANLTRFFALIEALCLYEKVYFTYFIADYDKDLILEEDPVIARAVDLGIAEILTPIDVAKMHLGYESNDEIPITIRHDFNPEFSVEMNLANAMSGMARREIELSNGGEFQPYTNFWRSFACARLMKSNAFFSTADPQVEANMRSSAHRIGQSIIEILYNDLASSIDLDLQSIAQFSDMTPLRLPPMALLILDSAHSEADLVDAIFRLRDELTDCRRQLSGFETAIGDPELPLKQRMAARQELSQLTEILKSPFAVRDLSELCEWKDVSSLIDLDALSEGKILGAVLGKPTKEAVKKLRERKVRHFVDMKTRIYNIAGYETLLKRKTGIDLEKFSKSELDYAISGGAIFNREESEQIFKRLFLDRS
jgi:hypothetical protein